MSQTAKRAVSVAAIVVASFAAGVIFTADFGFTRPSLAQESTAEKRGPVASVTVPSFADLADRVMPAVVSITSTEVVKEAPRSPHGNDPFEFFFPDPRRQTPQAPGGETEEHRQVSGGTGFIISDDGYILTNNHVIEGATKIEVVIGQTPDDPGRTVPAKIIGRDEATDIALIKVETKDKLPTVKLGDSDRIRVGDWAIAIGNPLQFNNTLTVGVISGRGRSIGISQATTSFEDFIQTDAAINYGNSGGPLLNINGEVIGINTAIRAYAQNIGFATPINVAKRIYPQLKDKGAVTRGYLGINITDLDPKEAKAFNVPEGVRGVVVEQLVPGKPAEKAGLQPGDVIVKVDEKQVKRTRDLIDYVSDVGPNVKVTISIYRDGAKKTLTATTSERTEDSTPTEKPEAEAEPTRNKIGISVQELTDRTRQMYGIDEGLAGIVVTDVKEVSPAGDAGVAVGDVITQAQGKKISTPEDLKKVIEGMKSGDAMRLYVTRGSRAGGPSRSFFRVIEIP